MGNISNVINYCMYDTWEKSESQMFARLFAWASKRNPSNNNTKIMYYVFEEDKRNVSKYIEDFSVLYCLMDENIRDKDGSLWKEFLWYSIECITHCMPYNIVLNSASSACAREIFLLMQDYPDFSFCFDVAKSLSLEEDIRELRRAIAIRQTIDQESVMEIFNIVKSEGWFVLSLVCDVIEVFDDFKAGLDEYRKWHESGMDESEMAEAAIDIGRKNIFKKEVLV